MQENEYGFDDPARLVNEQARIFLGTCLRWIQLLPNRINVAIQHLGEQSKENATRFSAQIEAALKEPFSPYPRFL